LLVVSFLLKTAPQGLTNTIPNLQKNASAPPPPVGGGGAKIVVGKMKKGGLLPPFCDYFDGLASAGDVSLSEGFAHHAPCWSAAKSSWPSVFHFWRRARPFSRVHFILPVVTGWFAESVALRHTVVVLSLLVKLPKEI